MAFPDLMTLFRTPANTNNPPQNSTPAMNPAAMPNPSNMPTPGNMPPGGPLVPADPNNATVPANSGTDPNAIASPMEQFKDLFTIDPNAKTPEVVPLNPLSAVDPKQFFEAAKKIDFSKIVTPELRAKIAAGGDQGVEAMMQAMNAMSQATYARSAQASSQINDVVAKAVQDAVVKQIPELLKKHNLQQSTFAENPALANPAMKPVVDFVQAQILTKHPNSSEQDLRKMTSDYFDKMAGTIRPTKPAATGDNRPGATDWESFFG